jgi:putative redox protein
MTQAIVSLVKGMQFSVATGSGHTLLVDSRPETGGEDSGPRPLELVAAGLAGCTAMDVIAILRKMQQKVTDLEVRVRTVDAEEHPRRFLKVYIEYIVTGHAVAEDKVKRAIDLSETRYCPAMATLKPGAHISHSYRILQAEPGAPTR